MIFPNPPFIEFIHPVPIIQLVCPLIIVLLTPVEDIIFVVPPMITDLGEVVDSELPITTELHAPVPPTEELPKTMVPVAPGKTVDAIPIVVEQAEVEQELEPIVKAKAAVEQDVLPIATAQAA